MSLIKQENIQEYLPKLLILSVIFYFLKVAFWPLTFLFIPSVLVFIIGTTITIKRNLNIFGFLNSVLLPSLLALVILIEFLIHGPHTNTTILKDIILIAVLFVLFYFLFSHRNNINNDETLSFTLRVTFYIIVAISIINLLKTVLISYLNQTILLKLNIPLYFSLSNDYNFFCIIIIIGFALINSRKFTPVFGINSFILKAMLNILFIFNIIFSGSRRGMVVFVALLLIYLTLGIRNAILTRNLRKLLSQFGISLLLCFTLSIIGYLLIKRSPNNYFDKIVQRYALMVGIDNTNFINRIIWQKSFKNSTREKYLIDSKMINDHPEFWTSSYANGTLISPVETRYGAGLLLKRINSDRSGFSLSYDGPNIIYYSNHTYRIQFKIKLIHGGFDSFNIGWWVKDGRYTHSNTSNLEKQIVDLNNGWYKCSSEYTFVDNHYGIVGFINSVTDNSEFIICDFELIDLNYDDGLPRYSFEVKSNYNLIEYLNSINPPYKEGTNLVNNGNFNQGIAFWKYSADSVSINIVEIDGKNCIEITRGEGDGGYFSLYYAGRDIYFKSGNEYQISFKFKPIYPNKIPFNVGFWVNEGEGYQHRLPIDIDSMQNSWYKISSTYKFKYDHKNLVFPINSQIDNSSFYITDIELTNISNFQDQAQSNIVANDTLVTENPFYERLSRWKFAGYLWNSEYTIGEKFLGKGFKYLDWYGSKYYAKKRFDWPHNPFITVTLYSGIIGLLLYIVLLTYTTYLYIKHLRNFDFLLIGYFSTLFFSFFSGSNPFDPPIMGFFILLPYLLKNSQFKIA